MKHLTITALAFVQLSLTLLASPAFGASCNVATTGISFGSYIPNQTLPLDSVGTIVVDCTKAALDSLPMTVNYSLELGRGGGANYTPRTMSSGAHALNYNLYRDALRSSVLGDGSGGTSSMAGSLRLLMPQGAATGSHSFYGRIFAGQNLYPGAYADALVVTINY